MRHVRPRLGIVQVRSAFCRGPVFGGPALVPVAGRLEVGDAGSCRSASSGNEPRVALTAATSKTPRLQRNSRVGGQVGKNLY